MLRGEGFEEFTHRTSFSTLRLVEAATDALDGFQQLLLSIKELLVPFRALNHHHRLPIDREDGWLARRLQLADVVTGIPLEFA